MADREASATCGLCGAVALVIFSPPNPRNYHIPPNFKAANGCPTWSDFHDRTEKELARDPNVERYAVAASRPGMGNTLSQPGAELKRKVKENRGRYSSNSV